MPGPSESFPRQKAECAFTDISISVWPYAHDAGKLTVSSPVPI